MPIYVYACQGEVGCGNFREVFYHTVQTARKFLVCGCGRVMTRDFTKEGFSVQPDIKPGFNPSIGMEVTSRADLRRKLAYMNAHSPDIPHGNPSDGVLVKEERRELENSSRTTRTGSSIYEKRREAGWGRGPTDPGEGISVEGTADYAAVRKDIRSRHMKPTPDMVRERKARYAG